MAAPKEKLDGELGHLHPADPGAVAEARSRPLSAEDAARLASLLAMMADPMRARILYALDSVDELCVGDLVRVLDASRMPLATPCGCCALLGCW